MKRSAVKSVENTAISPIYFEELNKYKHDLYLKDLEVNSLKSENVKLQEQFSSPAKSDRSVTSLLEGELQSQKSLVAEMTKKMLLLEQQMNALKLEKEQAVLTIVNKDQIINNLSSTVLELKQEKEEIKKDFVETISELKKDKIELREDKANLISKIKKYEEILEQNLLNNNQSLSDDLDGIESNISEILQSNEQQSSDSYVVITGEESELN